MEMYLLPKLHSNAMRQYGNTPRKTKVSKGRKYFTDENGRKFPFNKPYNDENGNRCYLEYDPNYSGDFLLFETEAAAKAHAVRRDVLSVLNRREKDVRNLSLEKLNAILNLLDTQLTVIHANSETDAYGKLMALYRDSEVCMGEMLESVELSGLPVAAQVRVYASLMRTVEGDEITQTNDEEKTTKTLGIESDPNDINEAMRRLRTRYGNKITVSISPFPNDDDVIRYRVQGKYIRETSFNTVDEAERYLDDYLKNL